MTFPKMVQRLCCDNERGTGKGVPIECMQASQHSLLLESFTCSDEGLTLEKSAFQIFHGGNSTFTNSSDKNPIFMFHCYGLTDATPQFL